MRVLEQGGRWRPVVVATALSVATAACGATSHNPKGGTGGATGTAGVAGAPGAAGAPIELSSVPSYMRRLSSLEYVGNVEDVLGVPIDPRLPSPIVAQGFDNNAEALGIGSHEFEAFVTAADEASQSVLASPELWSRVLVCSEPDSSACVRRIVTEVGLRLFRRPLLADEVPIYEKVYATARGIGESHEGSVRLVLVALMSSAQFLFRMELESGQPGTRDLNGYELATRLSYLLWSSAPDDELLQAAAADALGDDAALESQLERLWTHSRFDRFDHNFAAQWLWLRRIPRLERGEDFPEWSAELAQAAVAEAIDYFRLFSHGDAPFPVFLSGQPRVVPHLLAPLYGLAPANDPAQPVLLEDPRRTGFLASVAFATTTSPSPSRTSPTIRGRFILDQLLCSPTPPPPPDVTFIPEQQPPPENIRQALEYYWQQPSCRECHLQLDPLGLPFDNYDAIGRYRATYDDGTPIDTSISLPASDAYPEGFEVRGADDVVAWLQSDPRLLACFTQQVYAFGMGRMLRAPDQSNVKLLTDTWQRGPLTLKGALRTLVMSETFRTRLDGAEPEAL